MAGARLMAGEKLSYSQAALAALNAGCDMVLLCNQSLDGGAEIDQLIDGLTEAQLKGQWQMAEASAYRRHALLPRSASPSWDDLMLQADYMHALTLIP